MQVEWDYTELADAYLRRPAYAEAAIDEILLRSGVQTGQPVCDIGAGTGTLTVALAQCGLKVTAVEPNAAMAAHGRRRTAGHGVTWVDAVAEATTLPDQTFALVTFGSSFNVIQRSEALQEVARILQPAGWIACLFNHRVLDDPLQNTVQEVIAREVPGFSHGSRREDQSPYITESGAFHPVQAFVRPVTHRMSWADYVEAWRSHCTLKRQAGERFPEVIEAIAAVENREPETMIDVPYETRVWLAQRL
ncbi:MAG TPA: methyltransferase domain-containing protein [Planctomycetaceae bacterium]|nr:methyltransferase domain-containing protein [Planctomycetaceae bacterium]